MYTCVHYLIYQYHGTAHCWDTRLFNIFLNPTPYEQKQHCSLFELSAHQEARLTHKDQKGVDSHSKDAVWLIQNAVSGEDFFHQTQASPPSAQCEIVHTIPTVKYRANCYEQVYKK